MTDFDCAQYCLNYHTKENGWCSGLTSSNGHSTWCTALPNEGDWDAITNGDNDGIQPPYTTEYDLPACNQASLEWSVALRIEDGAELLLPCYYSNNTYSLKQQVELYGAIYNRVQYFVRENSYFLVGTSVRQRVTLLHKKGDN